ncbi:hypothetical protein SETIT_3G371800v2 [Setaria italica]|uniref:Uncharacterized protein n=1 Tax=Setaria italica TaxID=4555 RepID=A0A368QMW2_SETIT|nr:hypothetical protein SETIT_3G371800v2 [Setaria italica]
MVMRGLGVGVAPRRAPAAGPSSGGDENEPPGVSSAAASRPPLRAIQPRPAPAASSRKLQWPALTPSRGPGARAAAGKAPARRSASHAPARSLRKPAPRLGLATTGAASSGEAPPPFKVREAISFWEENRHNVQDALSMSQQHDSDALAKIDSCSDEGSVRNTEEILSLQLELDMLKTILMEEVKARAEAEDRAAALGDELKAANFHVLEACRQKEATEKDMETVESNLIDVIKELNELQKNNFQSPVFPKKMDMETSRLNSALDTHCRNEYVPYEDPKMQTLKCLDIEDSPLGTKLKRIQASLEKARNFNTRYQQDQASRGCAEQENDEVCREVILSLTEQLFSVQLQLNASKKNELLARQNLDEIRRIEFLLDESIEALVQTEVLEQNYVSLLRGMEEEICQLKSQLNQSDRCYEVRLKELEIKMQELKVEASASLASWNKEREIAEQRKAYVEQKNEEIKILELSNEDLKVDVNMKEEAEHQRRQQGKIEVELQNVRQQLRAVTSSGKAGSFLEDGIVDLADTTRFQSDMNSELSGAQEGRIFQREVSVEPAPQEVDQSDVEMEKAQSSDMDYWSENSKFEHPSACEELEQISASKQPELFGSGACSDQSLPAVESVIEVLKVNELPPVAPVRPNDPVNYMRAPSDELKRLRSRNHYEGHRTATDRRFWSIEQQDLYTSIYSRAKLFDMKWIDWEHIDSIDQFACVREQCAHLGLEQIISYHCDWNSELIKQFYSTVHISADKSSMTWMADGRRITTNKRAWEERFGIPGGVQTEIHSQFLLDDDDKRVLYTDAEWTLGQISGLSPLPSIANKIIRTTIYPKTGNTLHAHNWNLLHHIVEQHPFDIIALIFGEIELLISDRNRTKDLLLYAPYIMGMIMGAFEYDGPRESRHHSYKPRHSYKLKRTRRVSRPPASSVAAPSEQPPSTFQPEVEAHVDADHHRQFKAAGHRPQGEGEAVKEQTVLAQAITRTDLLQVVDDRLRPIRDSLTSMEGRIGRIKVLVRPSPFSRFPWYQGKK